jgi:hypothetical protein
MVYVASCRESRCRSIPRILALPRILATVWPIKPSNDSVLPTKPGALEEKLIS